MNNFYLTNSLWLYALYTQMYTHIVDMYLEHLKTIYNLWLKMIVHWQTMLSKLCFSNLCSNDDATEPIAKQGLLDLPDFNFSLCFASDF